MKRVELNTKTLKYRHDNKKCEIIGNKYKGCECCLEYTRVKEGLIEDKCLCSNKNYQKKVPQKLKEAIYQYI